MNFIKKNKVALIVIFICLILVVLAGFAVYRMFYPSGNKSIYGDRLTNAVEIDNAVIEQIKQEIKDTDLVSSVDYQLNVRTMKFFIDVKKDTKIEKAQQLSKIILDKLSTKVITYYDIQIYLTQSVKEDANYPSIGYHSKDATFFSWVVNKEGRTNEE